MTSVSRPPQRRCSFCGYSIPDAIAPVGDPQRPFCSEPCRDAAEDDQPFADDVGFKRRPVGVSALQPSLPDGIPGNAAILLNADEGADREGVLLEWVWRTLERDCPAIVVATEQPAAALVDGFLAHGWNVLPHLARGDLLVLDAFTERLSDEASYRDRTDRWNEFLHSRFADAFRQIRDPSDLRELSNQVDDAVEELDATDRGLVAFDSLTELASFTQDAQAANFLREVRAIVCKSRYVPLVAGGSVEGEDDLYPFAFPHDHEFLFDGIVDLELNADLSEGQRIRRGSVRKMDQVPVVTDWFRFEFVPGVGYARSQPASAQAPNEPGDAHANAGHGVPGNGLDDHAGWNDEVQSTGPAFDGPHQPAPGSNGGPR